MTRQSPALVSAEREADRLALAAARAEVERLRKGIVKLDADLDAGRAGGLIFTYGQVQHLLRVLLGGDL